MKKGDQFYLNSPRSNQHGRRGTIINITTRSKSKHDYEIVMDGDETILFGKPFTWWATAAMLSETPILPEGELKSSKMSYPMSDIYIAGKPVWVEIDGMWYAGEIITYIGDREPNPGRELVEVWGSMFGCEVFDAEKLSLTYPSQEGASKKPAFDIPTKPAVEQKYRKLVMAAHAPAQGSFEMHNDHLYQCTGQGKSWYCRDNSAGDPTLENEWVCYVYYQLATTEQQTEYAQQQAARQKRLDAQQTLKQFEAMVRTQGVRVDETVGEIILDTRRFHLGVGYGPGNLWSVDGLAVYLAHYTASEVSDWAWQNFKLEGEQYVRQIFELAHIYQQLTEE